MNKEYLETIDADVCVIGSACAGLAAAINARDAGAEKVVILEKTKRVGGTLGICGGFFAVESPVQKRLGIHHTAEECFRDLIDMLYWNCDARLVHEWMNGSGESVAWLEGLGVEFETAAPFQGFPDLCRSTYHVTDLSRGRTGTQMLKAMKKAAEGRGIEVRLETRATHLLRDDADVVCGVEAESKEGAVLVNAKSVVLATGSISNNKDLIARFYGGETYEDIMIMARLPYSTGDGLVMAEEIGAKVGEVSTLFMGPHNHGPGHSELTGMFLRRPESLKINTAGERFANEGLWTDSNFGWTLSFATDKQPGKMTFAIFDDRIVKDMIEKNAVTTLFENMAASSDIVSAEKRKNVESLADDKFDFYKANVYDGFWLANLMGDIDKEEQAGRVKRCADLAEIAEYTGCDFETLENTFERYNKHCKHKYDADFLKDPRHLFPLESPPYYVFQAPSGIDTCIGGIRVNYRLNVVDPGLRPIKGLYAAGVCTSGWLNVGYAYFGSELSFTLYSGRMAGKNAALYAKGTL
ncbi:MAG: FAD-dependent oxidoreductase [Clostridiales Family XIII bacterium]|nr:FAD-dependent oxidoreductase [Clostridiales Family XIII bacterium]